MKPARTRTVVKSEPSPPVSSNEGLNGARRPAQADRSILDILASNAAPRFEGVIIGKLAGFTDSKEPLVDFPANPREMPLEGRALVGLNDDDIGREVALLFESRDARRPIIIGLLQKPKPSAGAKQAAVRAAEVDGERLVLTAEKEVVLRCGEASIMLTRAGKVLIRGAYLLSRSSGANRIKGGSVQIN